VFIGCVGDRVDDSERFPNPLAANVAAARLRAMERTTAVALTSRRNGSGQSHACWAGSSPVPAKRSRLAGTIPFPAAAVITGRCKALRGMMAVLLEAI